jgi:hypothetical protein
LKSRANASRASAALRGWGTLAPAIGGRFTCDPALLTSLATVTRAEKREHSFGWSLATMRTGTGLLHWKRVEDSKCAHCLQQCKAAAHLGHFPVKSVPGGRVVAQL